MRKTANRRPVILLSFLFFVQTAQAYEYPLSSTSVGSAYFLGERDNQQTVDFLAAYARRFAPPQTDRYIISEIDVLTPYVQIVQRGSRQAPGDSEVRTEADLRVHPLEFLVKVSVYFNPAFSEADASTAPARGSGQSFSVQLAQKRRIAPLKTAEEPIYSRKGPGGIILTVQYDPAKISSAPMRITVHSPDGQSVKAKFDLRRLK